MAASDVSDGPVLSLINKRLRALRKKSNRITQMEETILQGKPINKEQEEFLRSKPAVTALIEELEKLRQPLAAAVQEELTLALQRNHLPPSPSPPPPQPASVLDKDAADEGEAKPESDSLDVDNLLNLLYFGSLFDVKPQNDFTSTMLTRTHERGCCLTYDYVTDDATDLLGERDLDLIAQLSGLLISRPVDSSLSHKNALQRCIEHAKLWLAQSDRTIEPDAAVTYAGLREKLNKIMASDYFTTTPEMKAPGEVVAAAAAGNYVSFQVPLQSSVGPVQVEGSITHFQQKDEDNSNVEGHETGDDQPSPVEELHQDELETESPAEVVSVQQEQQQAEVERNQGDMESKEQQYVPRRNYQNTRGGRGGGGGRRGGYPNGRGGRTGGRVGGPYQNGRSQYYDQPGNYYSRVGYNNNRGRGGRGTGGNSYSNHGSGNQGGNAPTEVGLGS